MYGCNKLYCEQLGRYYARHYKQLVGGPPRAGVDFRALRFPDDFRRNGAVGRDVRLRAGDVSCGGRGGPYACFVRPDTRIPFMAMPDAVDALMALADAPRDRLTLTAYNVRAFAPTADEVRQEVLRAFPAAAVTFAVDPKRQGIVDSWPEDTDDTAARRDWVFNPRYDFDRAVREYLIPGIREKYATSWK